MDPETFRQYLAQLKHYIEDQIVTRPHDPYDFGYAMGKLCAYYKVHQTIEESMRFDEGVLEGYAVGQLVQQQ